MEYAIKTIKILTIAIITAALAFAVFTLVTSNTKWLAGIRSFVVVSGSMQPTLPVGSVVYVMPSQEYLVGSIVAFTNAASQTVTHRVVSINDKADGRYYRLKGDANNSADSDEIKGSTIIGKSFFSIPYIGRLVQLLRTPVGFIALIIIPTIAYVVYELWTIKQEIVLEAERKIIERTTQEILARQTT